MDDTKKPETHMTSAAAFVEGGIQDSCDDVKAILQQCQRSSQCPMCLREISLKDTTSQELLEAVEHERKLRVSPPRNAAIFHHPTLGEFELHHLPVGATDADLEERIIQHLAAAAMGRTRQFGRREGQRNRSSPHGRNCYGKGSSTLGTVLNFVLTKEQFFKYPDLSPGVLTRLRAANVDTEKLARGHQTRLASVLTTQEAAA